ncbi:hypothetical protein PAMP_001009 [Pampus punctatissimus]
MFVTMIGAVVARALEQGTWDCEDTLDLLANRHFVRRITCHDSSKTSTVEAVAYLGIMAVHLEKEALVLNAKKCHDFGGDPRQLLRNIRNIRVACFSLSVKMHAVNTEVDLSTLVKRNGSQANVQGIEEAEKQILKKAAEVLTKTALDLKLLRFERWKCIAICCLLSAIAMYAESPSHGKLKPGELTREELHDLKELLTVGCVVCSSSLDSKVRSPYLRYRPCHAVSER